jgi:SAM-dependent methyltransferase
MSPAEDAVTAPDPSQKAGQLVAQALAQGDATGWFERLYAAAEDGSAIVPWDRGRPHWLLTAWAQDRGLDGDGRRALVVGCGLGADAEFIAGLGFGTVAFDISASAVRAARRRFPASTVDYQVADLLDPPAAWRQAFDLVVESQTIQALPDPPRRAAIARIGDMVAPGGTLVVIALARDAGEDPGQWPPWPVTRAEVEAFAADGLVRARIEDVADSGQVPPGRRWLAEFRRPM